MAKAYTTFQAAKLLGVSPPTVIKWTNDGKIRSYRTPGGHRRIPAGVLQDFLETYQENTLDQNLQSKIIIFIEDEDYSLLLEEFFDNPKYVFQARTQFQLGWLLSQGDITYLLWDWYDNTVEALRLLSEIKSHPLLTDLNVIGFIPSYEQLHPSFLPYFNKKTTKNAALQNLSKWIDDI